MTQANPTTHLSIDDMMQKALQIPGILSLAAGFTDNTVMPIAAVADIVRDLLSGPEAGSLLQYGSPPGRPGLRALLAEQLCAMDRDMGADPGILTPDDVIVTNGSQQALFIATQMLCQPGDIVLVEHPTYFVYLDVLRTLGVRAVGLPSRNDTLDVEALPAFFAALQRGTMPGGTTHDGSRIKAVYLVSYFSNPTALSLSQDQKSGLLRAMQNAGLHVPVLEDVAYRELFFHTPWPASSMLCMETKDIPVIVTGTLTKTFSTGLKVGYMATRAAHLRKPMLDLKRCQDFGTSHFSQAILERAISTGALQAFLKRARAHYAHKCQILHQALLASGLHDLGWRWPQSQGSLYLWLTAPAGTQTGADSALYAAALHEKILYVPGQLCCPDGGDDKVRLSFGHLPIDALPEAAERFTRAARAVAR